MQGRIFEVGHGMSCRSSLSQVFLKIDVLRNFASFTRKHLCWSLFLMKLLAKFLRTRSFTEHLQWLHLWFLQQNNLTFSVITITLGYNQKLSRKYCNYYHPPNIKISISYQTYAHLPKNTSKNFVTFPTKDQIS